MAAPEYLICLECESPCYIFTWENERLTEVVCEVCGNEEPEQFVTQDDFDTASGG